MACNYRPVSLTCVPWKLLEHIICSNIMAHLDEHKLLSDIQHAFRKRHSCETQLITVINDWAKILDDGGQVVHCRKQQSLTHQTVAFFAQNLGNSCGIHLLSSSATFSQNRLYPTMQRENPRILYEISFPLTRMTSCHIYLGLRESFFIHPLMNYLNASCMVMVLVERLWNG